MGEFEFAETGVSETRAHEIYRDMVRARVFDERSVALQRRGWMSGYPPFRGQEASQVGAAHAMAEDDWLFPTYRANAMRLARDVPMEDILLFRRGHPEFASGHESPIFPEAVPIATHIPHAVGAGMAMSYRGDDRRVLAYFGDGATSEGDFHEALNFAGVFEPPTVFFCENNGWAISLPEHRQTASQTIAQKAHAYGMDAIRVDGNDPLAVFEAVSQGLAKAADGEPVLIESLTYRQGPHTTSDDPARYRDEAPDLPEWRQVDPLESTRDYLETHEVLTTAAHEDFREAAEAEVDAAREAVERSESIDPDDIFASVYERPTPRIESQRARLREFLTGDDSSEHG
jgi:pyruvate dehydrogenase E1 component alpha subunit